jgi:hypothetical protein
LQHLGQGITDTLAWLPGWAAAVAVAAVIALLARRAFQQVGWLGHHGDEGVAEDGTDNWSTGSRNAIDTEGRIGDRSDTLEHKV